MYSWVYILKVFRDLAIPAPGHFSDSIHYMLNFWQQFPVSSFCVKLLPPIWLFFCGLSANVQVSSKAIQPEITKICTHECTYLKILKLFQYFDWADKNGNGRVRGELRVTAWPSSWCHGLARLLLELLSLFLLD